jgi:hypothetical protein
MKAPVSSGGDFSPAPSGTHPAVLVQLIDLGTQEGEYEGKVTHRRKIRMVFELHSLEAQTDDGKPMVVGRDFTLSSHENAGLRKFIEGWRGKAFSDDEASDFDYKVMLGKPCILNITHDKAPSGKVYANVNTASRLMTGMTAPAQVNPSVYFYLGEYDAAVFDGLPQWLKDKIGKSPEFKEVTGQLDHPATKATAVAKVEDQEPPFDDEIQF